MNRDQLIRQCVEELHFSTHLAIVVPPPAPMESDRADVTNQELAGMIDHTLLKPEATVDHIKALCREAREFQFASVCVNPCHVPLCCTLLAGTRVRVCTVVGFPLGATTSVVKAAEAAEAAKNGASEIDMVINIGRLKSREYKLVHADMAAVVQTVKEFGGVVKVILENALLTEEEKIKACLLAVNVGVDFVKTSTGFAKTGATIDDVRLMHSIVGKSALIKAAGGIRTRNDAIQFIAHGASRIGTSSGVAMMTESTHEASDY